MAFLLALIPVIIEAIGEGAIIGEGAAAVAAAASESAAVAAAASEAAAAAAEAASAAVAAGDVAAASAAASEASAAAVDAGAAAVNAGTAGTTVATEGEGLGSIIWENAQAFAKWVAKEVAKGALFEAAIRGLKATIHAIQVANPSPEASAMAELVTKINAAHQSLDKCTDDWLDWMDSHYDSRDSYGGVTVEGINLQNFQIVQQKVGDLDIFLHQNVGPLITAANKTKTLDAVNALKGGMMAYAEQAEAVNRVVLKMGSMMAAGLKDHSGDIKAAFVFLA